MYFKPKEESRPLFAECFRKIHLVTVPTPPFQALTMTLHIKLFTLFLSLASRSPESCSCCTSFLSPLDLGACNCSQLQVYKPGSPSFFSLALLSLFAFIFSVSSVFTLLLIYSVFPFSSNIQWYCAVFECFPGSFFLPLMLRHRLIVHKDIFSSSQPVRQEQGVSAFTQ